MEDDAIVSRDRRISELEQELQREVGTRSARVAEIGNLRKCLRECTATEPGTAPHLVPGVMCCAKCSFRLVRTNLHVYSGGFSAGDNKTEPCPNGCGPLWPVTWEQRAREAEGFAAVWHRLVESIATILEVNCNGSAEEVGNAIANKIRATQPPSVNEVAWLIEMPFEGKAHWWYGSDFTDDAGQAVRFSRKQDADQVILERGLVDAVAIEHMWCSGPTKESGR